MKINDWTVSEAPDLLKVLVLKFLIQNYFAPSNVPDSATMIYHTI